MKFWAIMTLIMAVIVVILKSIPHRPYKHREQRGRRKRPWRIG